MQTEVFEFDGYNGLSLPATLWLPEQAPRCILQIAHGMTEHIGRYTALAQELTGHGICYGLIRQYRNLLHLWHCKGKKLGFDLDGQSLFLLQ